MPRWQAIISFCVQQPGVHRICGGGREPVMPRADANDCAEEGYQ